MKIVTIVGARPQFIKAAAVSRAILKYNGQVSDASSIREIIVHTGQHFDKNMSDIFFEELDIPRPDYQLDINGLSHGAMTGQMMEKIEKVLLDEKPDSVLVYGDTNSTLAGALSASKLHIPVAHVEAGLRSFNRQMPEEINRVLTDHISSVLFCPTKTAVKNLQIEGFQNTENPDGLIHSKIRINQDNPVVMNIGDVMFDSVLYYSGKSDQGSSILNQLKIKPQKYGLVTIHRAENTDDPERLRNILEGLEKISKGLPLVWPMHPRIKSYLGKLDFSIDQTRIKVIEPVGYLDILCLEKNAEIIFTDSGGIQKEAYFFQVPCITLRDETEWVETVEAGANVIVGADYNTILNAYHERKTHSYQMKTGAFGNGDTSEKIVTVLKYLMNTC